MPAEPARHDPRTSGVLYSSLVSSFVSSSSSSSDSSSVFGIVVFAVASGSSSSWMTKECREHPVSIRNAMIDVQ